MKTLALDIGDRWVGVAISDPLGIIARPYETVEIKNVYDFLKKTIAQELITTIVVGYPKTLRGTESEQTKKTVLYVEELKNTFSDIHWVLWDERLTSKQAAQIKQAKTKEQKKKSHALAAALILNTFLEFQ
ncbi:MAG: Holliday junction resolvase RuvX, partial [bacterium]|nr:Holliday junction resolvase RuvX [bacterium]